MADEGNLAAPYSGAMPDWLFLLIAAFLGVNVFWFVLLPVLRTGGAPLPDEQVPAEARDEIMAQIRLGNEQLAADLLRQAHPMSARRAAHTVATWAKRAE